MMQIMKIGPRKGGAWIAIAAGVVLSAGCEVTNPGPVQDEYLGEPQSQAALVKGAERKLVESMNWLSYTVAMPAREIFPGGETTGGHTPRIQGGALPDDQVNTHWNHVQQARFIAEDAIRRFTTGNVEVEPKILSQAYIWAGYANRLLGENWCQVAFDGGPALPSTAALERAEAQFTKALETATTDDQRNAARAGRAQIRVALKNWAGAVSDAAAVPFDFVTTVQGDNTEEAMRNKLYWRNANTPYREYSMHFTYYYDYFPATGDPRVAWVKDPSFPVANAQLQGFGQVPWSNQVKYNVPDAPFRMATGREMVLIRAEALLGEGNWQAAMPLINQVRTSVTSTTTNQPLAPWPANSLAAAWTALMRERGIEMHLEARRLFDIRRWEEAAVPGDLGLPNWDPLASVFSQEPDARCFPIPRRERESNPNIPL